VNTVTAVIPAIERDAVRTAGVVSRGVALAIDLVVATLVTTVASGVVRLFGDAIDFDSSGSRSVAVLTFLVALPFTFTLYCTLFWATIGRTPGMAAMGIRVITTKLCRPGVGRSLARVVGYSVSAILFIGFLWAAVDPRHQAFHDKIAGTLVVYDH
jgi:uncharacterized RDD family membrane protein YckC